MDVTTSLPPRAEMLAALEARDASCDGLFYAAVTTTGVFCRPSCPSRHPRPEHVEFYASAGQALRAGYRPCRRCRPLLERSLTPPWMASLVARVEADPSARISDAQLRREGLAPDTVRRHFSRSFGMTFQAYCRARRLGLAARALRSGEAIDEVIFTHGWTSHSGFRSAFAKVTGAPPGRASLSPAREPITLGWVETPLGGMVAGVTGGAVCLLEFADQPRVAAQLAAAARAFRRELTPGASPVLDALRRQLEEYFAGGRRSFELELASPGTPFQRLVWDALRRIPYGVTLTYADVARELGRPGASRAVGQANGANRIAVLIPCHRVVAGNGGLGGYGGGLWRKLRLLETEGAAAGSGAESHGGHSGAGRQSAGDQRPAVADGEYSG